MGNRLTNFVIVEITPIGIQNIGWKFWIVFTVFNTAFLPVIYFLYPETGETFSQRFKGSRLTHVAHRTLEDLDDYYRNDPPLIVVGDRDVTGRQRPQKYADREAARLRRVVNASVDAGNGDMANKPATSLSTEHVE